MSNKLFVLGLDCAEPSLVYEKFKSDLPNISLLFPSNAKSFMKSTIPPITIPAWLSMASGKDPGEIGFYGFTHRKLGTYPGIDPKSEWKADASRVDIETIFTHASRMGKRVIKVGFPPSYPPQPIRGESVGCFLTPDSKSEYTYPSTLKGEVEKVVGDYIFDVKGFRSEDRENTLKLLYNMAEKHFEVVKYLIKNKKWDLFWFVEIGIDRLHHVFWKYMDRDHHLYEPGNKFENAMRDYYIFIDHKVGELLELLKEQQTSIMIVSDHGAKRMKGAFALNQWLVDNGYLVLDEPISSDKPVTLDKLKVNWKKTTAWGAGGYYGRIFINLEGREQYGVVKKDQYDNMLDQLKYDLNTIKDDHENPMKNFIFAPKEIYKQVRGDYPDLMAIFDDLYWRSAGTVGHKSIYLKENDTGPDDAVHAQYGILGIMDYENRLTLPNIVDIKDIYRLEKTLLGL
jgi:predicted AlkP superfamily phosphohydrolase/phosphomutase